MSLNNIYTVKCYTRFTCRWKILWSLSNKAYAVNQSAISIRPQYVPPARDVGCLLLSGWEFSLKPRQYSRKNVRPTFKLLFALPPRLLFLPFRLPLRLLDHQESRLFRFASFFPYFLFLVLRGQIPWPLRNSDNVLLNDVRWILI